MCSISLSDSEMLGFLFSDHVFFFWLELKSWHWLKFWRRLLKLQIKVLRLDGMLVVKAKSWITCKLDDWCFKTPELRCLLHFPGKRSSWAYKTQKRMYDILKGRKVLLLTRAIHFPPNLHLWGYNCATWSFSMLHFFPSFQ